MRIALLSDIHGNLAALEAVATELIAVPYGHAAMAQLAKLRRRDDWVCALMTGYMTA